MVEAREDLALQPAADRRRIEMENLATASPEVLEVSRSSSKAKVGFSPRQYPQVIKYMGSKASILEFVGKGLSQVHKPGMPVVDVFAGACAISGGFGHLAPIISNDIQAYSAVIASTYLFKASRIGGLDIVALAKPYATKKLQKLPKGISYPATCSLAEFNQVDEANRALIHEKFGTKYHLFTKYYSGTWWSAEQCVWIDAIRQVLDKLLDDGKIDKPDFDLGLTCLMHAMAYCSQGTGHYAQYRDAKTVSSMKDINKYRQASLPALFARKFGPLVAWNRASVVPLQHKLISEDYRSALANIPPSVVYADPPYAFVHYSRFYHAIETVVRYDYPDLQQKAGALVKGRYREDRHQSPFSIRSQVASAFSELFQGVKSSGSNLVLSYSNAGLINADELVLLAHDELGKGYKVGVEYMGHDHMTMGRKADHLRKVQELLLVAKRSR